MLRKDPQTIGPELKPNAGMSSIAVTGPVGLVFSVAILLIFFTKIHPARWLLMASAALGLATTLILRFRRRG